MNMIERFLFSSRIKFLQQNSSVSQKSMVRKKLASAVNFSSAGLRIYTTLSQVCIFDRLENLTKAAQTAE